MYFSRVSQTISVLTDTCPDLVILGTETLKVIEREEMQKQMKKEIKTDKKDTRRRSSP